MALEPDEAARIEKCQTEISSLTNSLSELMAKLAALESKDPEDKRLPGLEAKLAQTEAELQKLRDSLAASEKRRRKEAAGPKGNPEDPAKSPKVKTASGLTWF